RQSRRTRSPPLPMPKEKLLPPPLMPNSKVRFCAITGVAVKDVTPTDTAPSASATSAARPLFLKVETRVVMGSLLGRVAPLKQLAWAHPRSSFVNACEIARSSSVHVAWQRESEERGGQPRCWQDGREKRAMADSARRLPDHLDRPCAV